MKSKKEIFADLLFADLFYKGEELGEKMLSHIIKLLDKIVVLKGMHVDALMQHITNHLEEFDDLEHVKMMGGDEEYLNERKALLDEYDEIFEHFILTIEKITKMHWPLKTGEMMFKEIRESPYYSQLTQCANFLSLFLED